MGKKLLELAELESAYTAAKAAYHDAADVEARPQLEAREADIIALSAAINTALISGAEGENLIGVKRQREVQGMGAVTFYEISDGTNRSLALSQEEAADNWNNGVYWVKPE